MVRLISIEDDPSEEGGVIFTLVADEGDAGELARLVEEQGVPWELVEPADVGLALKLQMYLQSETPGPASINILQQEEAGASADDGYFDAYEDMGVHELMLRDGPRMEAYRSAMHANRHLLVGKVVLDVGTGTGVLAMFAARGGARKVYAVEASGVAEVAKRLVKANGLDGVVKVDVIVSEWMGFYLFHETMLPSVLYARDRWLKDGGVMMPSACCLYGAPCNAYGGLAPGIDLSLMASVLGPQPRILTLSPERLASEPVLLFSFDCGKVSEGELEDMRAQVSVNASRGMEVDGVCMWFDCVFDVGGGTAPVVLKTGPHEAETHWKQTVVLLGSTARVQAGEELPFEVHLQQDPANPRRYELSVAT